MSKKDYIRIAAVIKAQIEDTKPTAFEPDVAGAAIRNITYALCGLFADDNPQFNRSRFLSACGVQ